MCGIYFCLSSDSSANIESSVLLNSRLKKRGGDAYGICNVAVTVPSLPHDIRSERTVNLRFESSLLSLRGQNPTAQPLKNGHSGSLLCWNGEAWLIGTNVVDEDDSVQMLNLLTTAVSASTSQSSNSSHMHRLVNALTSVAGPYALVFFDATDKSVYFARDPLGRRSLLYNGKDANFVLSSVGDNTSGWLEVDPGVLHKISLPTEVEQLIRNDNSRLDCEQVEFPIHRVAFTTLNPRPELNLAVPGSSISKLELNSASVTSIEELLRDSVTLRICSIPDIRYRDIETASTAAIAILFSGGLDCTLLAKFVHDILPIHEDVDLLNVAFYNPRAHAKFGEDHDAAYDACPDRITAKAALGELRQICGARTWRLVEINIPFDEVCYNRDEVKSLMSPHSTEMDLSIATALYFAARGKGKVQVNDEFIIYESSARVLISGLGADELFGGYQRHATAFNREGFRGLNEELRLDVTRLGTRNLGRDDRVLSHWTKETRFPFLDEKLVDWATSAPVWEKCGLGQDPSILPDGQVLPPDKIVLRLLAYKLGLRRAAFEKKRAIQFGARSAKLSGKVKGTDLAT